MRALLGILAGAKDVKLQEAALLAIAALSKDNLPVATGLIRSFNEGVCSLSFLAESGFVDWEIGFLLIVGGPPLSLVLSLTKSRNVDVQLAACLWCVFL